MYRLRYEIIIKPQQYYPSNIRTSLGYPTWNYNWITVDCTNAIKGQRLWNYCVRNHIVVYPVNHVVHQKFRHKARIV